MPGLRAEPNELATTSPSCKAVCFVNGKRRILPQGRAEVTLLQYLREEGLTGTKLGCGEGGCGACTVMVSSWQQPQGKLLHRAVNACLCPLYAIEGMHVVTVEGIGNPREGLHPVQERLAKAHGSQCGFCTPGFVMSMYSLLRGSPHAPSAEDIEDALAGNLCRCTGYRPILDAFSVFAKADPLAYTEEAIAASKAGSFPADSASSSSGELAEAGPAHPQVAELRSEEKANGYTSSGSSDSTHSRGSRHGTGEANGDAKPAKGPVCPSTGRPCDCSAAAASSKAHTTTNAVQHSSDDKLTCSGSASYTRATAEPLFPPELKRRQPQELHMPGPVAHWYRPITLASLLSIKKQHPNARLVVGNTEVGIEMKFKDAGYPVLVGTTHVPELNHIQVNSEGLTLGGSVTLSTLAETLREQIEALPSHATASYRAILHQLKYFAGVQIRNTASIGGNIVTGSPISDVNPMWMATRSVFTVVGEGSEPRETPAEDFFLAYRKVDLKPHEVLLKVHLPVTRPHEYVHEFKQAHRRDDDIAIVNAGMRMLLAESSSGEWTIREARIAYGGVAAKSLMAPRAARAMEGQPLSHQTLQAAMHAVAEDVQISPSAPGGMIEFRRSLVASFLFRFFVDTAYRLHAADPGFALETAFPPQQYCESIADSRQYKRKPASGIQYYTRAENGAVVGAPERHVAADLQVSGVAQYTDDIPLPRGMLHAAMVASTRPHARLISVDPSHACEMDGVEGYFDHNDVPGRNDIGPILHDEEAFATRTVTCVGQIIGVIVADTEAHARAAAKAVRIEYEDLPAIISIDDAVEAGSYYEAQGNRLDCGDVDEAFGSGECVHVLEGVAKCGGQEHFYLEPQCCVVIPHEHDEMEVIASSQGVNKNQAFIAHVLGVKSNKVVARVKRLGGGFGGKETRSVPYTCAAAVAAWHTRRPVRLCCDRDEDMQTSGHRHAFMGRYKVGFTEEGKLIALQVDLYNNGGNSLDLSASIMDRALLHSDNSYKIPHMRVRGHVCRTNTASNTAFRGFGGPQGMLIAEMWLDQVARTVNKPVEAVRELNLYAEGDTTHYTQVLTSSQLRTCWDLVKQKGGYAQRRAGVDAFNRSSRYRKRGLALIPTKFGIAFTAMFLNQAGALVHIYTDGTVLVTHGGVEMGQGLHTKIAQVAAQALCIPLNDVFIAETATDKVANASPTAASASSDLYGSAVSDACRQLNERLAPVRAKMSNPTFIEVVNAAHLQRIDLSAHGFYITPGVTGFGGDTPFNYFTFGAALTEVEVDTLTGMFDIVRADIVMDVGQSLNPAIDIGQIEGGFVQGMGWTCLEELVWGDKDHPWVKPGTLFTRGPGTYKIPTANDIPVDMRVELLRDAPCVKTPLAHSSKAIGEPPFFLGAAVFFALKDAVYAARKAAGHEEWFQLHSPATPERLRMACIDDITASIAPHDYCARGSF